MTNNIIDYEDSFTEDILNFFPYTEVTHQHKKYPAFCYTEGVDNLAEQNDAYWLLDFIFQEQQRDKFKKLDFQAWRIFTLIDTYIHIRVEDFDLNIINEYRIDKKGFPVGEFVLPFFENTLWLPNEYWEMLSLRHG